MCEFQPLLGIKQPTVSHHLKQLVDAGLLEREKRGTYAYYRLKPGTLERIGGLLAEPVRRDRCVSRDRRPCSHPGRRGPRDVCARALRLRSDHGGRRGRKTRARRCLARLRSRGDGDGLRVRARLRRAHQPGGDARRSRPGGACRGHRFRATGARRSRERSPRRSCCAPRSATLRVSARRRRPDPMPSRSSGSSS